MSKVRAKEEGALEEMRTRHVKIGMMKQALEAMWLERQLHLAKETKGQSLDELPPSVVAGLGPAGVTIERTSRGESAADVKVRHTGPNGDEKAALGVPVLLPMPAEQFGDVLRILKETGALETGTTGASSAAD
jgi:hypothetical protein